MIHQDPQPENIHITGAITPEFAEILTPEAVNFVASLARAFSERREALLQMRVRRQAEIDAGKMPDFLPETEHIRTSDWTVSPVPADLQDRRVEITGPVERKMIINALNSLRVDRKSTRLNSSHRCISYAVFCLKKKN